MGINDNNNMNNVFVVIETADDVAQPVISVKVFSNAFNAESYQKSCLDENEGNEDYTCLVYDCNVIR